MTKKNELRSVIFQALVHIVTILEMAMWKSIGIALATASVFAAASLAQAREYDRMQSELSTYNNEAVGDAYAYAPVPRVAHPGIRRHDNRMQAPSVLPFTLTEQRAFDRASERQF
jgi:hypothetical protein